MPHNRTSSQGKTLKKNGAKKGPATSTPPETGPPQDSSAGSTETRQRSRSHGAASIAAQLLAHPPSGDNKTSARRRAATGTSASGKSQDNSSVFQFLDEKDELLDEDGAEAKTSPKRRPSDPPRTTTKPSSKDRKRKTSLAQSFHSDSGISVREHSPDRASSVASGDSAEYQPLTPPDLPFDAVNWELAAGSRTRLPMAGAYLTDTETIADSPASHSLVDLSAPETYYYPKHLLPDEIPPPPMGKTSRPSLDIGAVKSKDKSRRSISAPSGANLASPLASPKKDTNPRPRLYRQFGDLNHRLICHIQDEIAEMEDDLATLDELEAMHQSPSDSQVSPRQKLLAAKFNDLHITDWSVLHDKRQELMEKMVGKTEQYNRTLCAYSKAVKTLPSASERDVESYRAAAQGRTTKTDRSLLAHETDLILLDPRQSQNRPNPLYSTVAAIFAAVLLPLLAFGAISEFFGRIVVVAFTGAAIAFWASNGPPGNEYMIAPQNGWGYAAGYFGFMFIAAMIIP